MLRTKTTSSRPPWRYRATHSCQTGSRLFITARQCHDVRRADSRLCSTSCLIQPGLDRRLRHTALSHRLQPDSQRLDFFRRETFNRRFDFCNSAHDARQINCDPRCEQRFFVNPDAGRLRQRLRTRRNRTPRSARVSRPRRWTGPQGVAQSGMSHAKQIHDCVEHSLIGRRCQLAFRGKDQVGVGSK